MYQYPSPQQADALARQADSLMRTYRPQRNFSTSDMVQLPNAPQGAKAPLPGTQWMPERDREALMQAIIEAGMGINTDMNRNRNPMNEAMGRILG
jgi:hypothetical protein